MKSDFTRTNERTKAGLLEDGYKGFMRYLKNNFFDGSRQVGEHLVNRVIICDNLFRMLSI
jgi:hypothetical protein